MFAQIFVQKVIDRIPYIEANNREAKAYSQVLISKKSSRLQSETAKSSFYIDALKVSFKTCKQSSLNTSGYISDYNI